MKQPETPAEIAFDNWAHDMLPDSGNGCDIYEGSDNTVLLSGLEVRRLLADAFEAGADWMETS